LEIEARRQKDEEIIEIDGEESAGRMNTTALKRLLDGKDQTILEQSEEIANLK